MDDTKPEATQRLKTIGISVKVWAELKLRAEAGGTTLAGVVEALVFPVGEVARDEGLEARVVARFEADDREAERVKVGVPLAEQFPERWARLGDPAEVKRLAALVRSCGPPPTGARPLTYDRKGPPIKPMPEVGDPFAEDDESV